MDFIIDVLNYEFLQRALLTAIVVWILCGVICSFIILLGMSLMGDAISHAILPGVAISYMLGINYFIGAIITGISASMGISFVNQKTKLKNDTAIGIVFSAFFALGVILLMKAQTAVDLSQILFGNVLTVPKSEMYLTIIVGLLVLLVVYLFYKELLITSFDETMAKAYGMNTKFYHYLLMLLLTLVTVVSLKTVGAILVVAMLITPAATAYLLTKKLSKMIFTSASIGAISAIIGLWISVSYNLSTGPTIVLVSTFFFLLAFLYSARKTKKVVVIND